MTGRPGTPGYTDNPYRLYFKFLAGFYPGNGLARHESRPGVEYPGQRGPGAAGSLDLPPESGAEGRPCRGSRFRAPPSAGNGRCAWYPGAQFSWTRTLDFFGRAARSLGNRPVFEMAPDTAGVFLPPASESGRRRPANDEATWTAPGRSAGGARGSRAGKREPVERSGGSFRRALARSRGAERPREAGLAHAPGGTRARPAPRSRAWSGPSSPPWSGRPSWPAPPGAAPPAP